MSDEHSVIAKPYSISLLELISNTQSHQHRWSRQYARSRIVATIDDRLPSNPAESPPKLSTQRGHVGKREYTCTRECKVRNLRLLFRFLCLWPVTSQEKFPQEYRTKWLFINVTWTTGGEGSDLLATFVWLELQEKFDLEWSFLLEVEDFASFLFCWSWYAVIWPPMLEGRISAGSRRGIEPPTSVASSTSRTIAPFMVFLSVCTGS